MSQTGLAHRRSRPRPSSADFGGELVDARALCEPCLAGLVWCQVVAAGTRDHWGVRETFAIRKRV
jgi:hypothetical protein